MKRPSIERAVARAYLASIVGVSIAIVIASTVMTGLLVVRRDDAQATALAMTLATELHNHRADPLDSRHELVRHELAEQQWFQRRIEVWSEGKPIGADRGGSHLGEWAVAQGCSTIYGDGALSRLCAVHPNSDLVILVSSPVRPLLTAQVPIFIGLCLSAALAIAAFGALVRRIVNRSLQPLKAFEQSVAALPALDGTRVPGSWNAREIDELAHTFNELLERIDEAIGREKRFVANAAHELRTPLTRLRGQIELVAQGGVASPDSARRLANAARSCGELSRALDALLALAREDALALETVDLDEVAGDILSLLETDERARIRVVTTSALVRGDATLLGLAGRNLIDNALKYSEVGIEFHVEERRGRCVMSVLDAGPGIPQEDLKTVREPFVRGRTGGVRGAGLGLALAEHVAKGHGGRLVLVNRAPSGLQASLELPPWRPALTLGGG